MDNVAAKIYVVLSVAAIILFILTRRVHIRIRKNNNTVFSIGFILFKIELTKYIENKKEDSPPTVSDESEISSSFDEIFSLLATLLHYFQKCTITIRYLAIPTSASHKNMYKLFGFKAMISMIFVYIESKVEKLIVSDNVFILDPDGKFEFDIDLGILLLDLIILIIRLIIKGIKIGRLEKANVGN